ncbi:unnamed protein product [Urochloa humidicola]
MPSPLSLQCDLTGGPTPYLTSALAPTCSSSNPTSAAPDGSGDLLELRRGGRGALRSARSRAQRHDAGLLELRRARPRLAAAPPPLPRPELRLPLACPWSELRRLCARLRPELCWPPECRGRSPPWLPACDKSRTTMADRGQSKPILSPGSSHGRN